MAGIVAFLESPLMTWVKTFCVEEAVTFQDVCDGVYFIDVLAQIDQRENELASDVRRAPEDENARLQNWSILIKSIKAFYTDVLHQTVVTPNPNLFSLVEDPSNACCLGDMERVMVLLLGCAVQCERKAAYIDRIMSLEVATQQAIVQWIQQVTDSADHVISQDFISGDSDVTKQIYSTLKRVVKERDDLFEDSVTLKQEKNYVLHEIEKRKGAVTPPSGLERYHLTKELQEHKSQTARLSQLLEEKSKVLLETRDELDQQAKELSKTKSENTLLAKDAKLVRTYRDELDSFREQALKIEKYEKELSKHREKNHEMEYLKTRIEELKEDNSALGDAKHTLELQCSALQQQSDSALQDALQLQAKLRLLTQEKEQLEKKLEEALEENAALDFERTRCKDGYSGPLRRMISYTSAEFLHGSNLQLSGQPIADELSDSMQTHVTRLEMENDKLKSELEEIKAKLHQSQLDLEQLIQQTESDLTKRRQEFETQHKQLRRQLTDEVTDTLERASHEKLRQAREAAKQEKQQIVQDYSAKIDYLESDNRVLKSKYDSICDELQKWKAKDNKSEITDMQDSFEHKTDELISNYEGQIEELKEENERLQDEISRLCAQLHKETVHSNEILATELKKNGNAKPDIEIKQSHQNRQIENELQVKVHHLQREKDDLKNEIRLVQRKCDLQRENKDKLVAENEHLEKQVQELKANVESVRECSETHIKSLEQELSSLQAKADAMENLNEYLNYSTADENGTAHEQSWAGVDHSCDVSRDSLRSLPADLQREVNKRNAHDDQGYNPHHDASFDHHTKRHRREKISYVKGGGGADYRTPDSKLKQDQLKSSGSILNKLKSYVKTPKESEYGPKQSRGTPSSHRSGRPLQEVQMREKPAFDRNSRMRHTIQNFQMRETDPDIIPTKFKTPVVPSRCKPVPHTFSRNHPLRQTMPERKTTYHFPDKRTVHSRNGSEQSLLSHDSRGSHQHLNDSRRSRARPLHSSYIEEPTYCEIAVDGDQFPPNPYHAQCERTECCGSDFDSGFAQSAENSPPNVAEEGDEKAKYKVTRIDILSTETVRRKLSSASNNTLIQQIVKLQDHNIELASENGELRKSMDCLKLQDLPDGSLMEKYSQLEKENRKLKMIIQTLQFSLSGKNPYDKNEYHYFTNV